MLYDSQYYNGQSEGSLVAARKMMPFVLDLVQPMSVVDVGCGVGTWLRAVSEQGIADIMGIDGSSSVRLKSHRLS